MPVQEAVRKEMRLYKCWTSAREIELEVDEISFTYEREAQGPSAEAIAKAGESGGTGADGDENSKDNRANQRKAVREVKAKTTEALAKSVPSLYLGKGREGFLGGSSQGIFSLSHIIYLYGYTYN